MEEHQEIIDALGEHNPTRVKHVLTHHLTQVKTVITELLQNRKFEFPQLRWIEITQWSYPPLSPPRRGIPKEPYYTPHSRNNENMSCSFLFEFFDRIQGDSHWTVGFPLEFVLERFRNRSRERK